MVAPGSKDIKTTSSRIRDLALLHSRPITSKTAYTPVNDLTSNLGKRFLQLGPRGLKVE